jgi:hypothetical protein
MIDRYFCRKKSEGTIVLSKSSVLAKENIEREKRNDRVTKSEFRLCI